MRALSFALAAAAIALPGVALAHAGHGDTAGFFHGFEHPIGGLDHVLAMVAVGVFAFVLGGRALIAVPLAFVGMMAVGFLLGTNGIDVPFVELGIAASSIVIGGAAALGRPMPVAAAMSLVGVFAIFHGHAHGAEMPVDASGLGYAVGFMVATALLHMAGVLGAVGVAKVAAGWGKRMAQAAGAVFAAGGLAVLAGWL